MMSSTPATALIKTKRKTEMRCIQTCRGPCAARASASSGGPRSAVPESDGGCAGSGGTPEALEKGVRSVMRGSSGAAKGPQQDYGGVQRIPGNWGKSHQAILRLQGLN